MHGEQTKWTRTPSSNSTFAIGGVLCSKDIFVGNQTLVFQIKFCGKSPALYLHKPLKLIKPSTMKKNTKPIKRINPCIQRHFKTNF
ncbi:MAG: hypothetical protein A2033_18810 [Bacteroidetes bacterium GWA2_31_9]|nr:MAG: hypothetical protein A2033_18810 [Bacteroidetes bacterium GWA2_31_9]